MWSVFGAIFQIVILLLQSYFSNKNILSQSKSNKVKEISDAVSSSDISRINSVIQQLRS